MKIHLLKYIHGDYTFLKRVTDKLIMESSIAPVSIEMEDKFFLKSNIPNISFEYSQQYLENFRSNCISFFSTLYESQELVESIVFKDCNLHPDIEKIIKKDILAIYPELELEIHISDNYNLTDIRNQIKKHKSEDKNEYRYSLKKMQYLYDNFFKYYNPNTYITEFKNPDNPRKAIIVDVDGTICRLSENVDIYDTANSIHNVVVQPMKKIVELYSNDGVEIIFITCRKNKFRKITYDYLAEKVLPNKNFHLIMKDDNDHRNDYEIKKELYLNKIDKEFNVLAVFEDRSNVVEMWRSLGLFCLQPIKCDY